MRLDQVTLNDALLFILKEHALAWEKAGGIIKIFKPLAPPPEPEPLDITYDQGLLSFDLENADLHQLIDTLTSLANRNIIIESQVRGAVTGKLTGLGVDQALGVILPANGFTVRTINQVMYVGRSAATDGSSRSVQHFNIACKNGKISLEVSHRALSEVVAAVAGECGVSILVQNRLEGNVNAVISGKPIEEALTSLLMNSPYTLSEANGTYLIGDRTSEDMHHTRLIRLKHLIASTVESVIPISISKQLAIRVVKEHNGLVVTGPLTSVVRLEAFIDEIDVPTAQVLFDVLVVDYRVTDQSEFHLFANTFGADTGLPGKVYYPWIDVSGSGRSMADEVQSLNRRFGVSVGTLSDNFFIRLHMLQQEGIANVRSHPQIAALNGHSATIKVGTTQYYLLETQTIYPSQQTSISTQTAQRFETIKANMSLEVIPYVNSEDELIVELKPEFNTPAERFDPETPPTINERVLTSTVRLKNGETIVLGGLIQNSTSLTIVKLPILGSLPLIGRLFQNRGSTATESELVILVTPQVYYGSEAAVNAENWIKMR